MELYEDGLFIIGYWLQENDKIYLIRQENAEWMYGRSKRGCEGIFPINYVDIKVPLTANNNQAALAPVASAAAPTVKATKAVAKQAERRCRAVYDFTAEADEDLSIKVGDIWLKKQMIMILTYFVFFVLVGRRNPHNNCRDQRGVAYGTKIQWLPRPVPCGLCRIFVVFKESF